MTQEIELVVFENVSVMHQKALSLPFGKVSLRQLLMLSAGMIGAVIAYSVTGEILYPVIVFGIFVALGMVSTKVLTLDQIIKSMILFLIRGTSLSKKPQYMLDEKKKSVNSDNVDSSIQLNKETPTENKNIVWRIIYQIESLFGKQLTYKKNKQIEEKEETINDDDNNNNNNYDNNIVNDFQEEKRYSVDVTLQSNNVLHISNFQDNNHFDFPKQNMLHKIFSLFTKKKNNNNQNEMIPQIITVYLNGSKIIPTDYTINSKDKSVSIPLHNDNYNNSKYSVMVIDERNKETLVVS
ncbi:MAG: hypothetical protein OEL56_02275 [Nitrosopumilus sp.]|nr:hypothetical protein [Nitrosopumilus sp.]MDH3489254.1 hypothetical protein [Nitrosopumilus sp.]MDH3516253.1 hypothetical protein [Nitrosopumilus sp.]MDH3564018.1 hypothetical protein [Nitrosopumilus sp.]MDH5417574.1 hypothetical protein [Nitrosopumilus sp.]